MGYQSGTLAAVLDPSTTAWLNAVQFNGGTVSLARRALVDTLIRTWKANGVWTKLDYLWILAAENIPSSLVDIVKADQSKIVGAPTFTVDDGWTGVDASTSIYLDTTVSPNFAGLNFTKNNAHISAWSNTNTTSSGSGGCIFGRTFDPNQSNIFPRFSDGAARFRINDDSNNLSGGFANANSTGHYIATRDSSTTSQAYKNGALFASPNAPSGVGNFNDDTFFILAGNDSSGATAKVAAWGSSCQVPMVSIGGALNSTDVTNFYNPLRAFMTAIGVP